MTMEILKVLGVLLVTLAGSIVVMAGVLVCAALVRDMWRSRRV